MLGELTEPPRVLPQPESKKQKDLRGTHGNLVAAYEHDTRSEVKRTRRVAEHDQKSHKTASKCRGKATSNMKPQSPVPRSYKAKIAPATFAAAMPAKQRTGTARGKNQGFTRKPEV